jgi:hypothetical protein
MKSLWMWIATSLTSPADLGAGEIGAAAAMLGFGLAMLAWLTVVHARPAAADAREHYDEAA